MRHAHCGIASSPVRPGVLCRPPPFPAYHNRIMMICRDRDRTLWGGGGLPNCCIYITSTAHGGWTKAKRELKNPQRSARNTKATQYSIKTRSKNTRKKAKEEQSPKG